MLLDNFKKKMGMFKDKQKGRPRHVRTMNYDAQVKLDEKAMHEILPV